MEVNTKELTLAPLKAQVSKLENRANEITITTAEENASATELKAKLNETKKQIKERKDEITKPLNVALKSARDLFAPIEESFEKAERILAGKLIAYKQKVEAETRATEEKLAARVEKGTMKLETAERKIEALPTIQKTVQTDHGRVQFRKIKKVRITNQDIVPDQYWVIDEVKLRKDVLAGIPVPGAEWYEEEIV